MNKQVLKFDSNLLEGLIIVFMLLLLMIGIQKENEKKQNQINSHVEGMR